MATYLITGANRGIGLALARQLTGAGHKVIATARRPESASDLKATGAEVHALDVADAGAVAALKDTLGGQAIDVLINNAGVGDRAGLGDLDYETFADVLAINTIGPVRMIEAFAENVAQSETRKIATISSQLGSIANTTGDRGIAYRTSKAGVNMALRAIAPRLATQNITLLTLHPGWVKTDMGGDEAPVSPEDSAAGLLNVIQTAAPASELRFLDYQGQALAW